MGTIAPPWTSGLTQAQHDLILFGLVAAGLGLLATLVRVRFTSQESHGTFRVASLTANAVVAIAFVSYVSLVIAFALGYTPTGDGYRPNDVARFAWALRYMDWVITVPLLVIEVVAISSLTERDSTRSNRVGIVCAVGMIVSGFLGAFVVADGTDRTAYTLLGVVGALFFAALYGIFLLAAARTLPRLPPAAATSYRAAIVVLLSTWLLYPIVYGLAGAVAGGTAAVIGQLVLCAADMIAKIGFGTLVHRTAVLRSRNEEDLDPSRERRPRAPINDSVYVSDSRSLEFGSGE